MGFSMKITILRLLILITIVFATITDAKIVDRIVAIVNDEVITSSELEEALRHFPNLSSESLAKVKKGILEQLINERLAAQEIKRLGIKVTKEEVDGAIDRVLKQNKMSLEDLKTKLRDQGISYEEYRQFLKRQIEKSRLVEMEVESKITILEETLKKYYTSHLDQYKGYIEFHLRHILLPIPKTLAEEVAIEQKQMEIKELLRQGFSFSEIARHYSQAQTAEEGGDLGWIKESELSPEIRSVVQSLPIGGISDFIKTKAGYQMIQIVEKREVAGKSFEEVRDQIYNKLYQKKIEIYYKKWLQGLRKKAFIKVLY